jgi:hypothetical protein
MIGTVVDATAATSRIATATGQFTQQWNFATRTGSLNAAFDKANWNGVGLNMPVSSNVHGRRHQQQCCRPEFGGAGKLFPQRCDRGRSVRGQPSGRGRRPVCNP